MEQKLRENEVITATRIAWDEYGGRARKRFSDRRPKSESSKTRLTGTRKMTEASILTGLWVTIEDNRDKKLNDGGRARRFELRLMGPLNEDFRAKKKSSREKNPATKWKT